MRIQAKYRTNCVSCGGSIHVGETIEYDSVRRLAAHSKCPLQIPLDARVWSRGEGYGGKRKVYGDIVYSKEKGYLFILACKSQYVREDGMSFGVGDEQGYVYTYYARPATEAEARPLNVARERAGQRVKAKARLEAIASHIDNLGEYPEDGKQIRVIGKELLWDGAEQVIYGGGRWFVIGEWIWHIRNNGADGDNWSSNNVRTGGAGAIGHRVPYTATLAEEIQQEFKLATEG